VGGFVKDGVKGLEDPDATRLTSPLKPSKPLHVPGKNLVPLVRFSATVESRAQFRRRSKNELRGESGTGQPLYDAPLTG
jgi:hypothetical protein